MLGHSLTVWNALRHEVSGETEYAANADIHSSI